MERKGPVKFELLGMCYYEHVAFRRPRAGEYYLSGAVVEAWRAYQTLTCRYHVVKPVNLAAPRRCYVPAAPVVEDRAGGIPRYSVQRGA